MTYFAQLEALKEGVVERLAQKGVTENMLRFGGPTPAPERIRAPAQANTKFQEEQAFGDWAETTLARALSKASRDHRAIQYGFSSKIVAGEEGFKEQYHAGIHDTCEHGKRPDLLIVEVGHQIPDDVSGIATPDLRDVVAASLGAVEVRSSRTEVNLRKAYVEAQRALGKRVTTPELNFTVKVEDLVKVYRWIEVHNKAQLYAQVFLDEVHAIGVREIMQYIIAAERLKVEEYERNKKYTIMVPLSTGVQIGRISKYPEFEVVDRPTRDGRHDIFARPIGGEIDVDAALVEQLLAN
jgi:hypothetical protein